MCKLKNLITVTLIPILFSIGTGHAADINNGRTIYQRHCAMCHGANGSPGMAGAADFRRGQGLMQSERALYKRIEQGDKACPAYRGILSEQEIYDVIAYIRTLF